VAETPFAAAPAPQSAAPTSATRNSRDDAPGPAAAGESAAAERRGVALSKPARTEEPVYALEPDMQRPVKISGENPEWPSPRVRAPGTIRVEAVLGSDGLLRALTFIPGDLDPRLMAELRRSLATWRFEPARRDGQPVAVRYTLTLHVDYR
jgi:protein TonB